jgi:hypothetical protein
MLLIDDLLFAPITGFQFIMRTLAKVAEEQYTDDAPLKERLLELQVRLDSGEVTEEEYAAEETQILRDLRDIQKRKMEMAGVPADQMERGPLSASEATFTIDTNPPGTER